MCVCYLSVVGVQQVRGACGADARGDWTSLKLGCYRVVVVVVERLATNTNADWYLNVV